MTDDVRHSQTHIDIGDDPNVLVTLDAVATKFISAGLPRSMRTLQRYCANGTLECVKEATETGDTYFVVERSIDTAIGALQQLHDAKDRPRHAATERAVSSHVGDDHTSLSGTDTGGHSPTASGDDAQIYQDRPAVPHPDTSGFVVQLEARLEEKDEEIDFLREELIDRRGQIRDMKGIIDGQNQLLEAIQNNIAPVFKALASSFDTKRLDTVVPDISDGHGSGPPDPDAHQFAEQPEQARQPEKNIFL